MSFEPEDEVVDLVLVQPDQSLDRLKGGQHRHLIGDEKLDKIVTATKRLTVLQTYII